MKQATPECSIIIPVHNKWELTRNCLVSLKEHGAGHDLEVIVVDNGSSDATSSELLPLGRSLFGERFSHVAFAENRNFGPACNAGARIAVSPLLFFLNNDTLLTPNWFAPLRDALLADASLGAVGPLLLYEDNTVQHLGVAFDLRCPVHLYRNLPATHPLVKRRRKFRVLTGAALMLHAELFHACGGFFEQYRNGFEDVDLCCQMGLQGKLMTCVPESVIYHLESKTPGRKSYDAANGRLLHQRCGGLFHADLHHFAMRDGFVVRVNDLLAFSLHLPEAKEQALLCEAQNLPREHWHRLVQENPHWIKGREVLAATLDKEGNMAGAATLYASLADLDTTLARLTELERFVAVPGQEALGAHVQKRLDMVMELRRTYKTTHTHIREIQKRQPPTGNSFLMKLLDDKLREIFPDGRTGR